VKGASAGVRCCCPESGTSLPARAQWPAALRPLHSTLLLSTGFEDARLARQLHIDPVRGVVELRQLALPLSRIGQLDQQRRLPVRAVGHQVGVGVDLVLHASSAGGAFGMQHFLDLVADGQFVFELQAHARAQRQAALAPVPHEALLVLAPVQAVGLQREQVGDADVHQAFAPVGRAALVCASATKSVRTVFLVVGHVLAKAGGCCGW
jgi:hypothetical protein